MHAPFKLVYILDHCVELVSGEALDEFNDANPVARWIRIKTIVRRLLLSTNDVSDQSGSSLMSLDRIAWLRTLTNLPTSTHDETAV